jgi:hypothetical protein
VSRCGQNPTWSWAFLDALHIHHVDFAILVDNLPIHHVDFVIFPDFPQENPRGVSKWNKSPRGLARLFPSAMANIWKRKNAKKKALHEFPNNKTVTPNMPCYWSASKWDVRSKASGTLYHRRHPQTFPKMLNQGEAILS